MGASIGPESKKDIQEILFIHRAQDSSHASLYNLVFQYQNSQRTSSTIQLWNPCPTDVLGSVSIAFHTADKIDQIPFQVFTVGFLINLIDAICGVSIQFPVTLRQTHFIKKMSQ